MQCGSACLCQLVYMVLLGKNALLHVTVEQKVTERRQGLRAGNEVCLGLSGYSCFPWGHHATALTPTISWAWAPHSLGPKHLCYPTQRSLLRQVSASACLSQEWSLPGTVCLLYTYVLFCCLVALPSCSPQQSLWYDLHLLPRHFNKVFKVSLKKKDPHSIGLAQLFAMLVTAQLIRGNIYIKVGVWKLPFKF